MAKFKFRLEALKKHRNDRLMKAKKELSELNNEVTRLTRVLRESASQRRSCLMKPGGQNSVGVVKVFSDFVATETIKMKATQELLHKVEAEVERYRKWVEHLHREYKIVEKLEEKQREEFEERKKKKEQKALDSWVVERWKAE